MSRNFRRSALVLCRVIALLGSSELTANSNYTTISIVTEPIISFSFYTKYISVNDFPIDVYMAAVLSLN